MLYNCHNPIWMYFFSDTMANKSSLFPFNYFELVFATPKSIFKIFFCPISINKCPLHLFFLFCSFNSSFRMAICPNKLMSLNPLFAVVIDTGLDWDFSISTWISGAVRNAISLAGYNIEVIFTRSCFCQPSWVWTILITAGFLLLNDCAMNLCHQ